MTLKETIRMVLDRINQNSARYTNNERATCEHLLLPVLEALGWSRTDIVPTERTGDGFPDYTLYKNEEKKLMIEAKALNKPLDSNAIRQLGRYLQSEGVSYGMLTDGAIYELYKVFMEGSPFSENRLWRLELQADSDLKHTGQLLKTISYESIDNLARNVNKLLKKERERLEREEKERKAKQERRQVMDEVWGEMLEKVDDLVMVLKSLLIENLDTTHPDKQFEEMEVQDFLKEKVRDLIVKPEQPRKEERENGKLFRPYTKNAHPGELVIGNDSFNCNTAKDILIKSAEWLINQSRLQEIVPTGRRYLVAKEPKDPRGKNFHSPFQLSNGLWLETCFSSPACEAKAKEMCEHSGYPQNLVKIDWIPPND